jgi:hypothetical protein
LPPATNELAILDASRELNSRSFVGTPKKHA